MSRDILTTFLRHFWAARGHFLDIFLAARARSGHFSDIFRGRAEKCLWAFFRHFYNILSRNPLYPYPLRKLVFQKRLRSGYG